jgi:PKD repeat protein
MKKTLPFLFLLAALLSFQPGQAQISFISSDTAGCPGLTVNFANTSTAGVDFYWNIGATTYNSINATHTFPTAGVYNVFLTAFDAGGNWVGSANSVVEIFGSSGQFYQSQETACPGDEITFSTWDNAILYKWDFGDGGTASTSQARHSYASAGTYTVELEVWSVCGVETITETITVSNSLPTPGFVYSAPAEACINDVVAFYASPTTGGFTPHLTYEWNFGDGTIITGPNRYPRHTYTTTGTFVVELTVSNACGMTSFYADNITITDTMAPTLISINPNMVPGCTSKRLRFYPSGQNMVDLHWDLGDGTITTERTPTHEYASTGTYTVVMTATSNCGVAKSLTETITVADSMTPSWPPTFWLIMDTVCPGSDFGPFYYMWDEQVSDWDFGDGTVLTGVAPMHQYSSPGIYKVTRTVTNECGNQLITSDTVVVDNSAKPPIPFFDWVSTCPGDSIRFKPHIPIPNTFGLRQSYNWHMLIWDFGDGTIDTVYDGSIHYAYSNTGRYTVKATAVNPCGESSSYEQMIEIGNQFVPNTNFQWLPKSQGGNYQPCEAVPFTVDNPFWIGNNTIYEYTWDFGDGTTFTGKDRTVMHTYATPGTYSVSLYAMNSCGNDNTYTQDITITGACVGIDDPKQASTIRVYPNPFTSQTSFEFGEVVSDGTLLIYDIMGREVHRVDQINSTSTTLGRGNLAPGLYFYELRTAQERIGSGKLMVQ